MNAFGDATMALAFFLLICDDGHARLRAGVRRRRAAMLSSTRRRPRRARPARRRGREVGADPAAHLAPGRDGGPDAGLRADPRGDDGHGRRLPDRAHAPALRAGADGAGPRRRARRADAARRRASIALVQTDIKRVIAYSTMSQIGYMFVGVGIGAYASGMFHLMTHAFFKALLFLGRRDRHPRARGRAGHPQDGRPAEARCRGPSLAFLVGSLALVGIPPLAGLLLEGRDPRLGARERHARLRRSSPRACSARS